MFVLGFKNAHNHLTLPRIDGTDEPHKQLLQIGLIMLLGDIQPLRTFKSQNNKVGPTPRLYF